MRGYVILFVLVMLFSILAIRSGRGIAVGVLAGAYAVFRVWNRPPGGRHRNRR